MYQEAQGVLFFSSASEMEHAKSIFENLNLIKGDALIDPLTDDVLFEYAVNWHHLFITLPKHSYIGLLEYRDELLSRVDAKFTHFKAVQIDEDALIVYWDEHSQALIELQGAELADLFTKDQEKEYFEMDFDPDEFESEEAFNKEKLRLTTLAYERIDGFIEAQRVNELVEQIHGND